MPIKSILQNFIINPICTLRILGLFFCLAQTSCAATSANKIEKPAVAQKMTVAKIIESNGSNIQIVFDRSQRFYKLANDADPVFLELLKESEKNKTPVIIYLADATTDVILSVKK